MSKKLKRAGAAAASACAVCGAPERRTRENHRMTLVGDWGVTLENVDVIHCRDCGTRGVAMERMGPLMRGIAAAIVGKKSRLAAAEVTFLRKQIDYTGARLAKALGVTAPTVSRWETGREPIGPVADRLLRTLVVLASDGEVTMEPERLEAIEDGDGRPLRLTLRQGPHGEWSTAA
jgi:putative zinc finger/helix-turn-helix YgiT family protein